MTLLIAFLIGMFFGGLGVYVIARATLRALERGQRRGGMIDLTGTNIERRQDEREWEPTPRPTSLRLIRDNGSSEVIYPLGEED